ncbi:MAG: esterase-like activity of phytase family protein [Hyphomicrobiaceae bacterium]
MSSIVLALSMVHADPLVAQSSSQPTDIRTIVVTSQHIRNFHRDGHARPIVGQLRWRGGLRLSSEDERFGGFSGLEIAPDGQSFLAVSDAGTWISGNIAYKEGRPTAITGALSGPLKALENRPLRRSRDRDAEAVRQLRGSLQNGIAIVAFERNQRIGFFPIRDGVINGPIKYLRPPLRLPPNKGLEAVTPIRIRGHRFDLVAFAERALDRNGHHRGWIWKNGRGTPREVAMTNPGGFDITDTASLADGGLLVLERRYRLLEGVKMRLRLVPAMRLASKVLSGRTLIRTDMRYYIDNMEGLAVHRSPAGRTVITMISDDNFNPLLQDTLLLQFEMLDE